MSANRETVARYLDGFRRSDHAQVLDCLTDDVEWYIPGAVHLHGKRDFDGEIENPEFSGSPVISESRVLEAGDTVTVEGTIETRRKDGELIHLAFCDLFEMRDGKIRKLTSYLMPLP